MASLFHPALFMTLEPLTTLLLHIKDVVAALLSKPCLTARGLVKENCRNYQTCAIAKTPSWVMWVGMLKVVNHFLEYVQG